MLHLCLEHSHISLHMAYIGIDQRELLLLLVLLAGYLLEQLSMVVETTLHISTSKLNPCHLHFFSVPLLDLTHFFSKLCSQFNFELFELFSRWLIHTLSPSYCYS